MSLTFEPTFVYEPQPATGYVSSIHPAGQWVRGELPAMADTCGYGLPRPAVMREPGTNLGRLALADSNVVVNLGPPG